MVQNVNPTFVKTPNWGAVQITTGTGSSVAVTVYAGGANGSIIPSFLGVSVGTTAAFDVQWGVSSGGTLFVHGTASIPANAGSSDTLPTVNFFQSSNAVGLAVNSDGNPYIFLPSSAYSLQAKSPSTSSQWASAAAINCIVPSVGDF
jgi:hypothetical protein